MIPRDKVEHRTPLIDLVAVMCLVIATTLLAAWSFGPLAQIRTILGLCGVLFAPGYVTLMTLVKTGAADEDSPLYDDPEMGQGSPQLPGSIDASFTHREWVVLSVLTSVAVVAILGLVLGFSSMGVTPETILLAVNGYTLLVTAAAVVQRVHVADSSTPFDGFDISLGRLWNSPTRVDTVLNLAFVALLLVGAAVVGIPTIGDDTPQFTEFGVLAENESNENGFIMRGYLSTVEPGDTGQIRADVTNQEHQTVAYTVIVQVQRTEVAGQSVRVLDRRELSRSTVHIGHNETLRLTYEFTVDTAESGCRVAFLLYRGDVPVQPTVDNAYRELHLWHTDDPPTGGGNCTSLNAVNAQVNNMTVSD